jgi:regulator of protease activity HflC (stomatin/prohibitin superfamily)
MRSTVNRTLADTLSQNVVTLTTRMRAMVQQDADALGLGIAELLASAAPLALHSYGVAIEQIRLERIALPEENVTAVFEQMRAERRHFAAKYQASIRATP